MKNMWAGFILLFNFIIYHIFTCCAVINYICDIDVHAIVKILWIIIYILGTNSLIFMQITAINRKDDK